RRVRPGGHAPAFASTHHPIEPDFERSLTLRARRRFRTVATAIAASAALGLALFTTSLGPQPGRASSHREAPLGSADPQVDTTDFYMFVSPDKPSTVTLISTWLPFEEPAGGPNFYT